MQIDKFWYDIMTQVNKNPIVQVNCHSNELHNKFKACNRTLEEI